MRSTNRISSRFTGWVAFISLFTLTCATGLSQTTTTPKADIYANFLGTWVGSDHYLKNNVPVDISLELTITETKKKDAIRCDYTYSKKGQKDYDRTTRFLTLLPATSEMILQWKGEDKDHYKASGLDEFSQAGLGTFTAVTTLMVNGQKTMYRGTFELGKDSFKYQWEKSLDGRDFNVSAIFLLTRVIPASTVFRP
jgi:hypothetical protein